MRLKKNLRPFFSYFINWRLKMPLGDRTGPWGFGPMTGRGLGFCAGFPVPGFMNPGFGFGRGMGFARGLGRGFGRGRGWRRAGFYPFLSFPYPWAFPYGFYSPYGLPYGMGFPSHPYSPSMPKQGDQKE